MLVLEEGLEGLFLQLLLIYHPAAGFGNVCKALNAVVLCYSGGIRSAVCLTA